MSPSYRFSVVLIGLILASACSGGDEGDDSPATGGTASSTGGSGNEQANVGGAGLGGASSTGLSSGGSTGGVSSSSGGVSPHTGGASTNAGGVSADTGGVSSQTGGTSSQTGGTSSHTGGTSTQTGGTSSHTGGASASTGGREPGSGGTSTGGASATTGGVTTGTGGVSTDTGGAALGSGGSDPTGGATSSEGGTNTGGESNTGGAATGGTSGGDNGVFPDTVGTPKIMIVGDSISAGPGCYKKYLLQNLQEHGYSRLEFVGEYADDCGGEVRHSAVSCSTAEDYTEATFTVPNCNSNSYPGLAALLDSHSPDMLLIQLGVNDVWSSVATNTILGYYSTLVEQARTHNPDIVIVVAQIHKVAPNTCDASDAVYANAQALVSAVPDWALGEGVFVADLWTNSNPTNASDCVHPNETGAQQMGLDWYSALEGLLPQD